MEMMSFLRTFGSWGQSGIQPAEASRRTEADSSAPETTHAGNACWARTLGAIVEHSGKADAATLPGTDTVVRKSDLGFGDCVIVTTRNSVYSLWSLGDGTFAVSGGWFDQQADTQGPITVNGCTYGGSAIRHDVVAARGLFLEFGNNVSTTRIQDVRVQRYAGLGTEVPHTDPASVILSLH